MHGHIFAWQIEREIVREVPRVQKVVREEVVHVPGDLVEVERPYTIENRVRVPVFTASRVPTVYQQSVQPVMRNSAREIEIPCKDYDPVLCKVLVHVPKPVPLTAIHEGKRTDTHRFMEVSDSAYNGLIRAANRHLPEEFLEDLLVADHLSGHAIPASNWETVACIRPKGKVSGEMPPLPSNTVYERKHANAYYHKSPPAPMAQHHRSHTQYYPSAYTRRPADYAHTGAYRYSSGYTATRLGTEDYVPRFGSTTYTTRDVSQQSVSQQGMPQQNVLQQGRAQQGARQQEMRVVDPLEDERARYYRQHHEWFGRARDSPQSRSNFQPKPDAPGGVHCHEREVSTPQRKSVILSTGDLL